MSNPPGSRSGAPFEPSSNRPGYDRNDRYDDRAKPAAAEPASAVAAETEAPAATATAVSVPATAAATSAPARPVAATPAGDSNASMSVLPMDLDALLGQVGLAPVAVADTAPPAAEPAPVAAPAVVETAAKPTAKEESLNVLPVDIEALLGSKLG